MNEQKKTASGRGGSAATRQVQQQTGGDFVRGIFTELRRVTWPTRNEWVSATVLTLLLVIGIGFYTFLLDQGFGWLIQLLHLPNI
ncbi:MAG TPA: preprotein translocase subunit SecE [Candidatus Acidoferrales bacterium]|nr:preprotein translocase subunit SecE [Candidatus Acidoferrales bacterium]